MKWAYGVTTVPERFFTTLPTTLDSLRLAGFGAPRLFIDGITASEMSLESNGLFEKYEVTIRTPIVRAFGNWILGIWELYLRQPNADLYAMFQDDFITYQNLRQYLETQAYPARGYWNLLSFPHNEKLAKGVAGWHLSCQRGKGAVALVFNRETVTTILSSYENIVERPMSKGVRSHTAIDGAVVDCLSKKGWKEYIHYPSLVFHTGQVSTLNHGKFPASRSFKGSGFDALELVNQSEFVVSESCIFSKKGPQQIHYQIEGDQLTVTHSIGDVKTTNRMLGHLESKYQRVRSE